MTIIVETGAEVANANSYAAPADLEAYADLRGVTLTTDVEYLLIKAMDALQGRNWKGERVTTTQSLPWPRYDVWVDRQLRESTSIPRELKYGQLALAVAADTVDLMPVSEANGKGPVKLERVEGAVTREYYNSGKVMPVAAVADADALLNELTRYAGLSVTRA